MEKNYNKNVEQSNKETCQNWLNGPNVPSSALPCSLWTYENTKVFFSLNNMIDQWLIVRANDNIVSFTSDKRFQFFYR